MMLSLLFVDSTYATLYCCLISYRLHLILFIDVVVVIVVIKDGGGIGGGSGSSSVVDDRRVV